MGSLLAHDVAGEGGGVVLLHSGVCDRRMWEPQWMPLRERFRLVRPDLRGFGESAYPLRGSSHPADLGELLDHLGVGQAGLVGSSFGGRVALEFASIHPERVAQLLLLCPAFPDVPTTAEVERFAAKEDELLAQGDVEGAVELNVRTWLGPEASDETRAFVRTMQRRAFELQLGGAYDESVEAVEIDLGRITASVLVVSGGKDLDYFGNVARHLASELTRARHRELPWAGHLPSLERPDEITRLMLSFLSGED